MNLEERLRSALKADASHHAVAGAGAGAARATVRKRLRRRRVASTTAVAVALVGIGTGVVLSQGANDAEEATVTATSDATVGTDSTTAPASTPAAEAADPIPTPAAATTEATSDQGDVAGTDVTRPGELGLTSVNELTVTNQGLVAWGPANEHSLWVATADGQWEPVADPRPDPDTFIGAITSHDGWLYAIGGGLDSSAEPTRNRVWAARTQDLNIWEPIELALSVPADSAATYWSPNLYAADAGPNGVVVSGEAFVEVAVDALTSAEPGSYEWSLGSPTGDMSILTIFDSETGDELEVIDLSNAGVDDATLDSLAEGGRSILVRSLDGISFVDVSTAAEPFGALVRVASLDGQFAGATFDPSLNANVLLTSPDGTSWTTHPISVLTDTAAETIGQLTGGVLVATADGPVLTFQIQGDDDGWTEVRLGTQLGDHDNYRLQLGSFGSAGYAAVIWGTDAIEASPEPAGQLAPVEVIDANFIATVNRETGIVTVVDNSAGTVIASFPSHLVEVAGAAQPTGESLPDNIERIPGGVQLVVDGTTVARFDALLSAISQAADSSVLGQDASTTTLPTPYLVTTVDGETWTIRAQADFGDLDLNTVRAIAVLDDEIAIATETTIERGAEVTTVPFS